MITSEYSVGSIKPKIVENPKYQIGDIVYNSNAKVHFLIENIRVGAFGTLYEFRIIETNKTNIDLVADADKSKNLQKVG